MMPRPPATPEGLFGSSLPAVAPAAAAFTPPPRAGRYVGEVFLSAVSNLDNFEAGIWACDGSTVPAANYPDLAARLGTGAGSLWGAVGAGLVKIPDLRDRFPLMSGPTYSPRATGGAATHTLSVAEMPSHDHPPGGGADFFWTTHLADAPVIAAGANHLARNNHRATTGAAGGGAAHNNMPPYVVLTPFIQVLP